MRDGQRSKQLAALAAAIATFAAGCGKEELDTSFSEPAAKTEVVVPVAVAPVLVQQTRDYHPGDSFTVVRPEENIEISVRSARPEARIIACLLDFMTKNLAFEAKLSFTAAESCGTELPTESLKVNIVPPKKKFFQQWQPVEVDFGTQHIRDTERLLIAAFVRLVRGSNIEDVNLTISDKDLKTPTEKVLENCKMRFETGDFSTLGEYETYVDKKTSQYIYHFAKLFDNQRDHARAVFLGDNASMDIRSLIALNEQRLMREKSQVSFDFDVLGEALNLIADPLKAIQQEPANSTGSPSVTPIQ